MSNRKPNPDDPKYRDSFREFPPADCARYEEDLADWLLTENAALSSRLSRFNALATELQGLFDKEILPRESILYALLQELAPARSDESGVERC